MKFRRKSESEEPVLLDVELETVDDTDDPVDEPVEETAEDATGAPDDGLAAGPFDADEAYPDEPRVDLGSLLLPQRDGIDIQLQVDQASGQVMAVLLTAEEGGVELRAFAAPRAGDLWSEALPQLVADAVQRGGATAQRDGRWGPELLCQFPVAMPDGEEGVQPSRVAGVNGPRWLLRATFLGAPAVDQSVGDQWDDVVAGIVVHRGEGPLPVGEALPLVMPPTGDA